MPFLCLEYFRQAKSQCSETLNSLFDFNNLQEKLARKNLGFPGYLLMDSCVHLSSLWINCLYSSLTAGLVISHRDKSLFITVALRKL